MIKLPNALKSWGTPGFNSVLQNEIQNMDLGLLPLQDGLTQTSYVSNTEIGVLVLSVTETTNLICAKTGIFYAGMIAGSCCADDPTPVCEQTEYCEVQFDLDKTTAEATVTLLTNQ